MPRHVPTTITLPDRLLPALDRACAAELRSRSALIAYALHEYLREGGWLADSKPDAPRAA